MPSHQKKKTTLLRYDGIYVKSTNKKSPIFLRTSKQQGKIRDTYRIFIYKNFDLAAPTICTKKKNTLKFLLKSSTIYTNSHALLNEKLTKSTKTEKKKKTYSTITRIIIFPTNLLSKKIEINLTNLNIKTQTVQTLPV